VFSVPDSKNHGSEVSTMALAISSLTILDILAEALLNSNEINSIRYTIQNKS
jgi:hypothetical protein